MARIVHCRPETLQPIVWSERSRGNRGGHWSEHPRDDSTYHFVYALDLEAIQAEFDLPECIQLWTFPDGRTSLGCTPTRTAIGGGPRARGWLARRALTRWWERWESSSKKRVIIGPESVGDS